MRRAGKKIRCGLFLLREQRDCCRGDPSGADRGAGLFPPCDAARESSMSFALYIVLHTDAVGVRRPVSADCGERGAEMYRGDAESAECDRRWGL